MQGRANCLHRGAMILWADPSGAATCHEVMTKRAAPRQPLPFSGELPSSRRNFCDAGSMRSLYLNTFPRSPPTTVSDGVPATGT